MKAKNIFFCFLIGLLISTSITQAQWVQTNGPYGGGINSLASAPNGTGGNNIFAGTFGGVFLSTNNGSNWNAVNAGLKNIEVFSLAISGINIFAGTNRTGIFLSTNNGTSWTAVNNGIASNTDVHSLAVSPNGIGGNNIYAGYGHLSTGGVYRSTDNGSSWNTVNNGLPNAYVYSLASSPNGTGGNNIFAGTGGYGVYLSTDNGSSWNAVNNGLPMNYISALAISSNGTGGNNIFAGTGADIITGNGVFLSTDNGSSWNAVNNGLQTGTQVSSLAISPNGTGGNNIFAGTYNGGVFLSTNNGSNWNAVNSGLTDQVVSSLVISPNGTGGNNIFAGTGGTGGSYGGIGVFLSTDNGSSWNAVNNGLTSTFVSSLAISGINIFAGTNRTGIFLSTNNGTSWTAVNTGLPAGSHIRSLASSSNETGGNNIFAGISGYGVYLSTNNGVSWTTVNNGLTNLFISVLALSPNQSGGNNIFAGTATGGVFISTNNGSNWNAVNNGLPMNASVESFAISPNGSGGNNIFAGIYNPGGVFLSTNNGASWTSANNGLTNFYVTSLAVNGSNLFATAYGRGVFLSTNNGANWNAVNNGLPIGDFGNTLAISPNGTGGSNIFATAMENGIYLSTNNGSSWSAFNTGLTSYKSVYTFAIGGNNIFIGTINGVWRRPLSEIIGDKKTPVIFIPGIMGSPLYNDTDPNNNHLTEGERIWLDKDKLIGFGNEFLDVLQLDMAGVNPLDNDYNIKVAPLRNDGLYNLEYQYGGVYPGRLPFAKYRGFFTGLINSQYKLDNGDYDDTEGEVLYCFTYDWRKSIIYNSNLLSMFIDSVKSRTSSPKVNLVAHSMGGMIAKECIKEFGTDRIKKLIFIGTPHLGSPKILYTLLTGDLIFPRPYNWVFNKNEIQKISLNMPSAYLLFPTEKYRDISLHNGTANNGVSLYSFCFWTNNSIPLNYFQTQQYYKETVLPASRTFNSYLLDQADLFQQSSLDADFGQIEVYNIVGSTIPTIGYVFDKINGNEHKPDPWYNLIGDETVPLRSAEMVSSTKRIADYYIEGVKHSDLPANSQVVSIVLDLLKEPAVTHFNNPPVTYGTTTLQIQTGSPVELHAYDSQNRHTGPTSDSTWVTDIPGSFYISNNLADTTSPKVILLPKGDMYSIKLVSQNTVSEFDLSIKDINNGQNTVEAEYLNIPILSNTLATCSFDSLSENVELNLDWDGNGTIDTVINPTLVTDLKDNKINKLPSNYYLGQNYPNPFNPNTTIKYSIPQTSFVKIQIYNILGREVKTLVNEEKPAGNYEVEFNGSKLSSGVYFYSITANNFHKTNKMILAK